jgi:hypothetical protein
MKKYNKSAKYQGVNYTIKEVESNLFKISINGKNYDEEGNPWMFENSIAQAMVTCESIIKQGCYSK